MHNTMSEINEIYVMELERQLVASREKQDERNILCEISFAKLEEVEDYIKARKQVATRVVSDGVDELSAIENIIEPHE